MLRSKLNIRFHVERELIFHWKIRNTTYVKIQLRLRIHNFFFGKEMGSFVEVMHMHVLLNRSIHR